MINNLRWKKRVKATQILHDHETDDDILVVRLKMKHISEKEALKLKIYLEKTNNLKLKLTKHNYQKEKVLYIKKNNALLLRFEVQK
jgi:hypothetical protein